MAKKSTPKLPVEILRILCLNCKIKTKHKIIHSVSTRSDYDADIAWSEDFQIIQCDNCEGYSFRTEYGDSESYNFIDNEGTVEEFTIENIYPKRSENSWLAKDFYNIPYELRRIYKETIDAYNNGLVTLTAGGIRALVEGICNVNGSDTKSSLFEKINGLAEKNILSKTHADILHNHRFLGNDALHELSIPDKKELTLAMEIIEHVFDHLYEIPKKGIELKKRREDKDKPF